MVIINADNIAKIKKGREVDERLEQNQNKTVPRSIVKMKKGQTYTHTEPKSATKERKTKERFAERKNRRKE